MPNERHASFIPVIDFYQFVIIVPLWIGNTHRCWVAVLFYSMLFRSVDRSPYDLLDLPYIAFKGGNVVDILS